MPVTSQPQTTSVATLVHAFITGRVDYSGSLLIGAPKKTTDKLQRVLNSAARIVSNARKFDRGLTSPAVEWVNVVLESPRSFFAVLISMEGADQETG